MLKSYANLLLQSEEKFLLAEPRCVVVVGCTDELDSAPKKDSFEIFRGGQRATEVITFDELFKKIEILLTLLEGNEE